MSGVAAVVVVRPRVALIAGLWLAVVLSAIAVTYSSHVCHRLFADLTQSQREENRLQQEWGQYLVEQSTWGALGRIETLATTRLAMHIPQAHEIVMVRP